MNLKPLFVIPMLVLAGCSSPIDPGPAPDPAPAPTPECKREGYPCTFGETSPGVLARSLQLLDQASSMLGQSGDIAAVQAWLEQQPEVAEVTANSRSVRFRLEGGRPMMVYRLAEGASETTQKSLLAPVLSRLAPQDIVGSGGSTSILFLSPFEGVQESIGQQGIEILKTIEEEAAAVNAAVNVTTISGTDVDVETLRATKFRDYAFVYITTHGDAGTIFTGETVPVSGGDTSGAYAEAEEVLKTIHPDSGLEVGKYKENGDFFILAGPDFFGEHQSGNTRKNIVFLDGCSTVAGEAGQKTADLLAGPNGVVIGWDNAVSGVTSKRTAKKLVQELLQTGLTLEDAWSSIKGTPGIGDDPDDPNNPQLQFYGNDQLRIREIISFTENTIDGQADDGENDALELSVWVDGIKAGQEKAFAIDFALDGASIGRTAVASPNKVTGTDYVYEVSSGHLELGFDLKSGHPYVLEAIVTLPEGGFSRTSYTFTLEPACPAGQHLRLQQVCAGPSWRMTVSGPYFAGTYEGTDAKFDPTFGLTLSTDATGEDFSILVQAQPDELSNPPPGHSSYTLGYDVSSDSTIDFVNLSKTPPLDLTLFNGDGVSVWTQPNGSELNHPPEAVLELENYVEKAATMSGTVLGSYMACYGDYDPGPSGFCDIYEVSIEFDAENGF